MEYLMTYGWAILIIAVVLGALFSLGVFSSGSFLGSTCIASAGYLCSSLRWVSSNAVLLATVGQNTGTSWTAVVFAYVPQGTSLNANGIPQVIPTAVTANVPLNSGSTTSLALSVIASNGLSILPSISSTIGTSTSGTLWACFQTSGATITVNAFNALSGCQYIQIATLTTRAS